MEIYAALFGMGDGTGDLYIGKNKLLLEEKILKKLDRPLQSLILFVNSSKLKKIRKIVEGFNDFSGIPTMYKDAWPYPWSEYYSSYDFVETFRLVYENKFLNKLEKDILEYFKSSRVEEVLK